VNQTTTPSAVRFFAEMVTVMNDWPLKQTEIPVLHPQKFCGDGTRAGCVQIKKTNK
jgi:hypothetical protein